jgi:hypothetical protein
MAGSLMESRFSLTLSRLPWCKHWNTISDSRTGKSVTAFFPTYSYSKLACLRLRLPESIPHNVEVIRTSSTGSQKLEIRYRQLYRDLPWRTMSMLRIHKNEPQQLLSLR